MGKQRKWRTTSVRGRECLRSLRSLKMRSTPLLQRWIDGSDGLVQSLQEEKFNFQTFEAQVMLKEAASRGRAETVRGFLEAGVPLEPIPAPKPKEPYMAVPFDAVGW